MDLNKAASNMKLSIALMNTLTVFITAIIICNLTPSKTDNYYVKITTDGEDRVIKSIDGLAMGKAYI